MSEKIRYFMGANSPEGFYSLFDEIYNPYQNIRAFIIKGGAGTGKSTVMKKVAAEGEKRGLRVEYIHCSSDPGSLDGVRIEEKGVCLIDGTAPHIIEPKFPGVVENIIDTGAFWDSDGLRSRSEVIRRLTVENSLYHRRSTKYLSAAGALSHDCRRQLEAYVKREKIDGYIQRLISKEASGKKSSLPGRKLRIFAGGITPEGELFFDCTFRALADRIIGIRDEMGAASGAICDRIGEIMLRKGYDVIFCQCPMKPKSECEHLIIPELRLAFVTLKRTHNTQLPLIRTIHCERFYRDGWQNASGQLKWAEKMSRSLLDEAVSMLKKAKEKHDELEAEYRQAMNFEGLNEYTDRIVSEIFK